MSDISRRTYNNHSYRPSDILARERMGTAIHKRTQTSTTVERFHKGRARWMESRDRKARDEKISKLARNMPVVVDGMGEGHVVRVDKKTANVFVTFGRGEMSFSVDRVHKKGEPTTA